jgi:GAF domain-containing protein
MERMSETGGVEPPAHSLERQLGRVLDAAREAVGVDRLHLWGVAPTGDRLLYVLGSGLSEADRARMLERPELALSTAGGLARALREQKAALVDGARSRRRSSPDGSSGLSPERYYAVPVLGSNAALGVMVADNTRTRAALTRLPLRLLTVFASHVAAAVENARMSG